MNIHQLRAVCEVVKQGLRMSNAAEALYRTQPGISRQIRDMEDEIGVRIFHRRRNKIEALTPAGKEVLRIARRVLRDIDSLRLLGREYSSDDAGELTIATTHTHARYSLPRAIEAFTERFPRVRIALRQANPVQCCELAASGDVDLAIATGTPHSEDLVSLPAYRVIRCIVAPRGHPVLEEKRLTLEGLAKYPLITIDSAFSGRGIVNEAFSEAGLSPNVVLSAVDPDVTKEYVQRGMGIAVLSRLAYNPTRDGNLGVIEASHLFRSSILNIFTRKDAYLRSYVLTFIELYAPHLNRKVVQSALQGSGADTAQLAKIAPIMRP
jgi:LysR family transcriptional regulator, cys regulon transcriptional activator